MSLMEHCHAAKNNSHHPETIGLSCVKESHSSDSLEAFEAHRGEVAT